MCRPLCALAVLAMLLAGCSTTYKFNYRSGATLNPDPATGESRPVRVLVYLLKQQKAFNDASEEDLWKGGDDAVKKDLVGDVLEIDVSPAVDNVPAIPLYNEKGEVPAEVTYIGVFAQYVATDPPPQRRRVFLKKGFENRTFRFDGTRITTNLDGQGEEN